MELCDFLMWVWWVNYYGNYVNFWNDNCGIIINGSLLIFMMEKV